MAFSEDASKRFERMVEKESGRAVRPYREDGYVNLVNNYGTNKDITEHYHYEPEPQVPDEILTNYYESNGLFAKIIDAPAEEALKHGFKLEGVEDSEIESFYKEALDELDWEETATTAIKWARLYGGSIAVLMVNDGRGLDEPLDWEEIQSIDDIRVYDRSLIQPDYASMYNYDPVDPFRTRGSRLGMPEYYDVYSKYGNFRVHDSRCLVFQNGRLPENTSNTIYELWGTPEYTRLHRAIRDAEIAHSSAAKMLDKSVQPVYKMKNLSAELATEEGENRLLRRLQTIDMARSMMNTMAIDADGEDYDFRSFQFTGVNDVISASCNLLSAISNIPQVILFGSTVGGLSTTDDTSMENWYSYVERIQKRMLRSNLRYLLSIIFQAGLYTKEIKEMPEIKVEFEPLWSLSETEQVALDQQKAQVESTKAQTANVYVQMQALDPSEVRKALAESDEFDVETMLDDYSDDELFADMPEGEEGGGMPQAGGEAPQGEVQGAAPQAAEAGNSPDAAPAATKLPQDMTAEEKAKAGDEKQNADEDSNSWLDVDTPRPAEKLSVGVYVVSPDGKVLSGIRAEGDGRGKIGGPGGHIEEGETPEEAAIRETQEEFGITPKELIPFGYGPTENSGLSPELFLCTEYEGEIEPCDGEMSDLAFRTLKNLNTTPSALFEPFKNGLGILLAQLPDVPEEAEDEDEGTEEQTELAMASETAVYDVPQDTHKPLSADELRERFGRYKNLTNWRKSFNNRLISLSENHIISTKEKPSARLMLSPEDAQFLADEFGIDADTATEDDLYRVYGLMRGDGGPGSGNFGHEGRPGEIGGSSSEGGSESSTASEGSKSEDKSKDKPENKAKKKSNRRNNRRKTKSNAGKSAEKDKPGKSTDKPAQEEKKPDKESKKPAAKPETEKPEQKNTPAAEPVKEEKASEVKEPKEAKAKEGFGRAKFVRDGDKMNVTNSVKIKLGKGACTLKEGTVITDIKDFAGKGCKKGIDVEEHLVSQNKGTAAGEWVKSKGNAKVTLPSGKEREAEIHWFEHSEAGQVSMKVKFIKKGTSK